MREQTGSVAADTRDGGCSGTGDDESFRSPVQAPVDVTAAVAVEAPVESTTTTVAAEAPVRSTTTTLPDGHLVRQVVPRSPTHSIMTSDSPPVSSKRARGSPTYLPQSGVP